MPATYTRPVVPRGKPLSVLHERYTFRNDRLVQSAAMAMTNYCPACGQPIAAGDINIQEGVALCRSCGKLSRLSEIASEPAVDPRELETPPPGCSREDLIGGGTAVRASCRSIGGAFGALFVCLFWNGIVSVFLVFALSGVYMHLIGPLPKWFPVPTSHGHVQIMSSGETVGLCIFLIPFVTIGLVLLFVVLNTLLGRIEVSVIGDEGRVRSGFGPINLTRRFDASKVKKVGSAQTSYQVNGQSKPLIQIEADRTIRFGSMLPMERREWMQSVLFLLLVTKTKDGRRSLGPSSIAHR